MGFQTTALSFSYSDGSARRIDGSPEAVGPGQARDDPEVAGTLTATGLVMAHSQEVLRMTQMARLQLTPSTAQS